MKRKAAHLKSYTIVMGLFVSSVILGIMIFFGCIQSSIGRNSRQAMMNNVSRQSEHLRTILSIHYQYLNEISRRWQRRDLL